MRHGPAEDRARTGIDADRALTPSGRDRVRDVARALADGGERPAVILTSPYLRCRQTAEIVAQTFAQTFAENAPSADLSTAAAPANVKPAESISIELRDALAAGGAAHAVVRELLADPRPNAMLCGHEPDLSELIARLVREPIPLAMDKAMVVGLDVNPAGSTAAASLRFVLNPKTLHWDRTNARA